jgi:hypothetical protein
MSTSKSEGLSDQEETPPLNLSPDRTSFDPSDTVSSSVTLSELATEFNERVLLSEVAARLPAKRVVFNFENAEGSQPKDTPGSELGEIFHEGEIVPNVTPSACKPGCTHSEIEHLENNLPSGTSETQHIDAQAAGNANLVSTSSPSSNVVEIREVKKTAHQSPNRQVKGKLCELCRKIDFWTLQDGFDHRTYVDLGEHGDTCDFCALLLDAVLEPETFVHDPRRYIKLVGKCEHGSQHISKIEVRYPSLEKDRGDSAKKGATFVRCAELDVFVDYSRLFNPLIRNI